LRLGTAFDVDLEIPDRISVAAGVDLVRDIDFAN